jgi:hypothetical protein
MALNLVNLTVGEHKKRKRRNAKSANLIGIFLCAPRVGAAHFAFSKPQFNVDEP